MDSERIARAISYHSQRLGDRCTRYCTLTADDLAQEAWAAVHAAERNDPDGKPVRYAALAMRAYGAMVDAIRSDTRFVYSKASKSFRCRVRSIRGLDADHLTAAVPPPPADAAAVEFEAAILRLGAAPSARSLRLLTLHFVEGRSKQEAADLCGVSASWAHQLTFDVLQEIRCEADRHGWTRDQMAEIMGVE